MDRVVLLPRIMFGCGFADCEILLKGWDARCNHVGQHMKDGSKVEEWDYSNVIRNLIRQESTKNTAREITSKIASQIIEFSSESIPGLSDLSHAYWDPRTSRTLL